MNLSDGYIEKMHNDLGEHCPVCPVVKDILGNILEKRYKILEQRIDDYHFHQLYFKVNAQIDEINDIGLNNVIKVDNKIFCNCHWSTIEFLKK